MFTIGNPQASLSSNDSNGPDVVAVTGGKVALASGTLGSAFAYIQLLTGSGVRSQKLRAVLYADAAGVPGTLVAVTDEVLIDNTTTLPAWIQFPTAVNFGATPGTVVKGSTYWVGLWWGTVVNASNAQIGATVAAGHVFFNNVDTYSSSGNPPNSPTGDSGFAVDYDVYWRVNESLVASEEDHSKYPKNPLRG